jgi:thiamine-monophosphate kinase
VWPAAAKESEIADFARGLAEDQAAFKVSLLGGDTTAHKEKGAPFTISVTMIGAAPGAGLLRRTGAQVGDDIYVTGAIGDAGLGLRALKGEIKPPPAAKKLLAERYRLPSPRLAIGGALPGLASASIDVSDGLLADAGHIAERSGVAMEVSAARIPLSAPAAQWLGAQADRARAIADLASCGDDYEILFTAAPARRRSIEMAAQVTKTAVARIGVVTRGQGVKLLAEAGEPIETPRRGFEHFRE